MAKSSSRLYKVTVIGGGTGSFTILTGLKNYPNLDLAAIVAMTDDGGSSGLLRDEQGVLPPGDSRQCLVALSESEDIWRRLFTHRFANGGLGGHNFGNLFITALEQITGSYEEALEWAGNLLKTKGQIIPVTLDDVRLVAQTQSGEKIIGEHNIDLKEEPISSIGFDKDPSPNPRAIKRILESDLIVIAPGDIYTSILPNLLVDGICSALKESRGKKIYVCNLMAQKSHTQNFKVIDFIRLFEKYNCENIFDYVVYNSKEPQKEFLQSYASEGEFPVKFSEEHFKSIKTKFLGRDILSQKVPKQVEGDKLIRALIRHDPYKTASVIYGILNGEK